MTAADTTSTPDAGPEQPTCTGCGAAVRWVLTVGGRRIPIDPRTSPTGNIVPVRSDDGTLRARVLTGDELPAQEPAWVPHWATCTRSAVFRRQQGQKAPKCLACGLVMDEWLVWQGRRLGDRSQPGKTGCGDC